jgi:hypothetical protein
MSKTIQLIGMMFDLILEEMKDADQNAVVEELHRKAFFASMMDFPLTNGDVCAIAKILKNRAIKSIEK